MLILVMILMNIDPILSFAIPTWNRQNELKECLNALIKEIENTKECVEIFVSDNDSTDLTPKILEEYSSKYNFIKYSRNEKNMGFDMNLIKAIENSKGKYIWTFSDDDLIKEGVLNKVIESINKYEPTYIAINYDHFIADNGNKNQIKMVETYKIDEHKSKLDKYNYKILSSLWLNINFKEILEKEFTRITYLNMNIFKRASLDLNLVKNNIDKVKHFSHIFMMAQATINGGAIILPIICVHKREDNSNTNINVFYKNLPDTMEFIFSEYHIDSSYTKKFFKNYRKIYLNIIYIIYISFNIKIYRKSLNLKQFNKNLIKHYVYVYFNYVHPIIPRKFAILVLKIYRLYRGKGADIPSEKELRFD